MEQPQLKKIKSTMAFPPIILASQSPRRKEILRLSGLSFSTVSIETPEHLDPAESIESNVRRIAEEKAKAAIQSFQNDTRDPVLLGADTVVAIDGRILGKPANAAEALEMLLQLQGRTHEVHTGFALLQRAHLYSECATTEVTLNKMTEEEILHYINTAAPFDKAGSYGIQDPVMACFVSSITGCYYNVMGLPLSRVWMALQKLRS